MKCLNQCLNSFLFLQLLPAAIKFVKSREQDVIQEIVDLLSLLEKELKDKKFFGGESIGLVDIAGCIIALWLDVIQEVAGVEIFTKEKHPKLFKWSEEYMSCSIIKETLPPRADLLAFWQSRVQSSARQYAYSVALQIEQFESLRELSLLVFHTNVFQFSKSCTTNYHLRSFL